MNSVLQAEKIVKIYENGQDTPALNGVSLSINMGESVAVVGKSGSGKSTLMHILATLDRPTSGRLLIKGVDVATLSSTDLDMLRNKKFGFVFQQFFLNGRSTVLENVTLPLVIMGVPPKERKERGQEVLLAVDLSDKAQARASDLSGGQKQRLVIARSLVSNPEVIFADEPTGNLDTENGQRVMDLLFRLQKERGITLIIVTHDPDLARQCDRTIIIRDGQIAA